MGVEIQTEIPINDDKSTLVETPASAQEKTSSPHQIHSTGNKQATNTNKQVTKDENEDENEDANKEEDENEDENEDSVNSDTDVNDFSDEEWCPQTKYLHAKNGSKRPRVKFINSRESPDDLITKTSLHQRKTHRSLYKQHQQQRKNASAPYPQTKPVITKNKNSSSTASSTSTSTSSTSTSTSSSASTSSTSSRLPPAKVYYQTSPVVVNPVYETVDCKIDNRPHHNAIGKRYLDENSSPYLLVVILRPCNNSNKTNSNNNGKTNSNKSNNATSSSVSIDHFRVHPDDHPNPFPEYMLATVPAPKNRTVEILVHYSDYMNHFRFPGAFDDTYNETITSEKRQINRYILQTLKTFGGDHQVIYLEGPARYTTRILSSHYAPSQLHAVNVRNIFDGETRAQCYQALIYEIIRDWHEAPAHWLLDYCCSPTGNECCRPMKDIELLFYRGMLPRQNGILWLTFSLRSQEEGGHEQKWESFLKFLFSTATTHGYNLKILKQHKYGRGMIYLVCRSD